MVKLVHAGPTASFHHSDQGSQASIAFGERCKKMGVRPSTGTVGDAYGTVEKRKRPAGYLVKRNDLFE